MNLMKSYNKRQREQKANDMLDTWMKKADTAILYTLHTEFGFGKERLRKFFVAMVRNHKDMTERFRSDGDDGHYWVMAKRLKDDGIDIDEFEKEVEKI